MNDKQIARMMEIHREITNKPNATDILKIYANAEHEYHVDRTVLFNDKPVKYMKSIFLW